MTDTIMPSEEQVFKWMKEYRENKNLKGKYRTSWHYISEQSVLWKFKND
jgi:hypothetical protein